MPRRRKTQVGCPPTLGGFSLFAILGRIKHSAIPISLVNGEVEVRVYSRELFSFFHSKFVNFSPASGFELMTLLLAGFEVAAITIRREGCPYTAGPHPPVLETLGLRVPYKQSGFRESR